MMILMTHVAHTDHKTVACATVASLISTTAGYPVSYSLIFSTCVLELIVQNTSSILSKVDCKLHALQSLYLVLRSKFSEKKVLLGSLEVYGYL
jgi:hypothetical protein